MTLRTLLQIGTLAALTLVAACATAPAPAPSAVAPADPLTNARFYTGSLGNQGIFPGKLVCLRCDLRPGSAAEAKCAKEGHQFALEIPGDPTIHPLIPGDARALQQLNGAAHGADVTINGTLYPNLGVIVVAGLTAR